MDPASVLADEDVPAKSLTHALPYWAVVHGAMLLAVTYLPPRTGPPRRWSVAALIGGFVALVVGLLIGWTTGLMLGGGLAGFVHWLTAGRRRKPFTPQSRRDLVEDGAALATLRT